MGVVLRPSPLLRPNAGIAAEETIRARFVAWAPYQPMIAPGFVSLARRGLTRLSGLPRCYNVKLNDR